MTDETIPAPARVTLLRSARLVVPYAAGTAVVVGVPVLAALEGGPTLAAALAVAGGAGGALGSLTAGRTLQLLRRANPGLLLPLLWVLCSAAALTLTTAVTVPWMVVGALLVTNGFLWSSWKVLMREGSAEWGGPWLRRFGPLTRVGAVAGSLAGTAVAVAGLPLPVLLAGAVGVLAAPRDVQQGVPGGRAWCRRTFAGNAGLYLAGCGPVALEVAFVSATAGPQWAGVSMAVYTVGALASPHVVRRLPERLHARTSGRIGLAAVSNLAWFLVLLHPVAGALAARGTSAILLFAAEGSADVDAHRRDAWVPALAGRSLAMLVIGSTGIGLYTLLGSVPGTAAAYAGIGGTLYLAALAIGRQERRRDSAELAGRIPAARRPEETLVGELV